MAREFRRSSRAAGGERMTQFRDWLWRQTAQLLVLPVVLMLAQAGVAQTADGQQQQQGNAASGSALPQTPTPTAAAPQQNDNQPLGTAAAPYEKPLGAAVSRPVGAAIAPGKQRRRRTLLIRIAIVVGAAAALGTVVALSKASPSTPSSH
jgi:hypothetical protein